MGKFAERPLICPPSVTPLYEIQAAVVAWWWRRSNSTGEMLPSALWTIAVVGRWSMDHPTTLRDHACYRTRCFASETPCAVEETFESIRVIRSNVPRSARCEVESNQTGLGVPIPCT